MPSTLTYPGVYIEEISSGVRTISGVATSIAAFVGWAPFGPTEQAVRIGSITDYRRRFGDIHPRSYLGYAVQHFFDNGGSDAYVVRIVDEGDTKGTGACGGLDFEAISPGAWPQWYGVEVKLRESDDPTVSERFSLSIVRFATSVDGTPDTRTSTVVESFVNLSADSNDPRFVTEVIGDEDTGSRLVRVTNVGDVSNEGPKALVAGTEAVPDNADSINEARWIERVKSAANDDAVLDKIDLFNILSVPGLVEPDPLGLLAMFCQRKRAFLIADCHFDAKADSFPQGPPVKAARTNGAFYFPWLRAADSLSQGRLNDFPPSGFIAGMYARTDASRGVWKAPAGTETTLVGVSSPKVQLTDRENGVLNVLAVNCIRSFPAYGTVSWGARTLDGANDVASEWKYIPVRRTALFIEESLYRGTQWAVFEPNDEPLWSQLRLNIGGFMHDLFRQGAFQGRTPREAYFVKCDKETTTPNDVNRGVVNVVVGFAPLKPAEFIVVKLTQIAGQIES